MTDPKTPARPFQPTARTLAIALAVGVGAGLAIGTLLGIALGNLATGIAMGFGLGAFAASAFIVIATRWRKDS